jgi:hypothetical protein
VSLHKVRKIWPNGVGCVPGCAGRRRDQSLRRFRCAAMKRTYPCRRAAVIELLEMLPTEDQATLSLAMRVASPLIEQLTQLAAQHTSILQATARR